MIPSRCSPIPVTLLFSLCVMCNDAAGIANQGKDFSEWQIIDNIVDGLQGRVKREDNSTGLPDNNPGSKVVKPFLQDDDYHQAVLFLHNQFRQKLNGSNIQLLKLDDALSQNTRKLAENCDANPSKDKKVGRFEEVGLLIHVSEDRPQSVEDALEAWSNAGTYGYSDKTCVEGNCESYLQLAWSTVEAVGCATSYCSYVSANATAGYLTICNYGPRGIVAGRRPFREGERCSRCPAAFPTCDKETKLCAYLPGNNGAQTTIDPLWPVLMIITSRITLRFVA